MPPPNTTQTDYLEAALTTVLQIHLNEPEGDVLLFLTGQEEIDTSCSLLHERMAAVSAHHQLPELIVLPIYSTLPSEMQTKVFEPAPPGARKAGPLDVSAGVGQHWGILFRWSAIGGFLAEKT